MPIFGICRGIQMLNVAAGGTLYQDISMHSSPVLKHRQDAPGSYGTHAIDVYEDSLLLTILGSSTVRVNTYHHQAVKEVAPGFKVSATARDGIIESIESSTHSFAVGVQFHPERMWENSPPMNKLFAAFVNAAGKYSKEQKAANSR